MKKANRLLVFVILACVLLSGCTDRTDLKNTAAETSGSSEEAVLVGNIPVEFPLTTHNEKLNILCTCYDGTELDNVFVWNKYEEMTGVDVNWTAISKGERSEKVHSVLTNGKKLDLILRCKVSANRLIQYGESGLILDLAKDDMLKNYAPNCWAYLQSHPDTMASVMNPDGTIYALPQVNSGAELRVALKLFVNKQWLERVGMDLPTTTEEFRALLTAFKEQDANGNGDPNDEIPFCCADLDSAKLALYGAFGLGNRGFHNTMVDWDEESGAVRFIPASESYKKYLEYMHGLYTDGLMDNLVFTINTDQWKANAAADRIGVFSSTNLAMLPADKADNWVGIGEALEGPQGDKLWCPIRANFHTSGAALIPATCSDPQLALRWLDYFWTDEGTLFYHMGVEGGTFTATDGGYDYMPYIYDEIQSGNHSFDDVVAKYSPYPGGSNPTVEIAPYFMGGEMAAVPAQTARELFKYGPKEYWPSFTFTSEENALLNSVRTDITKYCDSMLVDFVCGTRPLSEWDAYIAQLERLNVEGMLDVYQSAVDRYHTLSAAVK